MSDQWLFIWIALALVLMPLQFHIAAPYGRHQRTGWGPMINTKWGWLIMEVVALASFVYYLLQGSEANAVTCLLASCFIGHYIHRSFIFPFYRKSSRSTMPLTVCLMAIIFNLINGSINGDFLARNAPLYEWSVVPQGRVVLGFIVFTFGAMMNVYYDRLLIGLRKKSPDNYVLPQGGFFKFVSCPNHLGEIIEWAGFALMCWNLPALAFFVWTASNLIPRAWHHHQWYCANFANYPADRKAVIPWIC